jgi:uncharacterized protein YjbI with pentapeptide repeats/beta-lactamase regulating signal transducer with metallopeptidase domain
MLEAIVNVALRAILASVLLGGVLVLAVLAATRWLSLTASTRHALWTIALIATAVMPLAGVGVSLARGMAPPPTVTASSAILPDPLPHPDTAERLRRSLRRGTPPHDPATTVTPSGFALANLNFNFTPRLSRELAIGVVGVWLAGALIGLVGLVASIVRVRGLKKRSSPLEGDLADELPWLTDVAAGREIYLRLSFETETPVAIGFRRPVILIPTELASAAGLAAIESLILHEHAHLQRYDDWTNLVQRAIERIFWFNPVVWLVGRRIALEREIASDDAVVEKTGAAHAYATSLWRLAREMRMPEHAVVAPGALLTRKQISVRIELLLDKNRARLHRSPGASFGIVLAGLLAVGFVATSAPAVELPAAAPLVPRVEVVLPEVPNPHQRIVIKLAKPPVNPPSDPLVAAQPPPPVAPVPPTRHALIDVDVAAIVHEALADVPMQIADEAGMAHGGRTLSGVKLTRDLIAACKGCSMRNADLRGLDLHGLTLTGDDMSGVDLSGVNLAGTELRGVSLARANLSSADLRGAVLTGVEMRDANFYGALLDDVRLRGVSFRRVSLRGTVLRSVIANCIGCDFSGMDLRGQDLHGITLTGANLSRADLREANLANVHFNGVAFAHANLTGADLTGASLNGCDLTGVSLHGAKTAGMTMQGTGLDG